MKPVFNSNAQPEDTITSAKPLSWAYAEDFHSEDKLLTQVRNHAYELGCHPVEKGAGATLAMLIKAVRAKSVVEVGTGIGVSGLWMLRALANDAVLTTIDVEPVFQNFAKQVFAAARIKSNSLRMICGAAVEVLPRLTDCGYDLVFLDADWQHLENYVQQSIRILRPGGALVIDNALWQNKVADPTQRDPETTMYRNVGLQIQQNPQLQSTLLTCGDGLLVGIKN